MKLKGVYILFILFTFLGCKKVKEKDIQPSKDFALIINNISSIIPLVTNVASTKEHLTSVIAMGKDSLNTCANIYMISGDTLNVSNSSPLIFDINFSNGCVDNNGVVKKGKIRCTTYGYLSNSGASCNCSFIGFENGGNNLLGSFTVTNTGAASLLVTTSNLKIKVGKKFIYFDTDMRMTLIGGGKSPTNLLDNSYTISSKSVLIDRYNKEFKVFSEDLHKSYACKWISNGYAELNDSENKVQVIDFGDGTCENKAVVSIEEKVYTIEM